MQVVGILSVGLRTFTTCGSTITTPVFKMVTHLLGLQLTSGSLCIPAAYRRRTISTLSRMQSASALALVAFSVVHLSAPMVGLLGVGQDVNDRIDGVSRWMLLGRVAYQSAVGEGVLWVGLGVHLLSGGVKRLIRSFTVAKTREGDRGGDKVVGLPEETPARAKMTVAQMSGWILAPFVVHHAAVNRLIPSMDRAPISGLSPSELDYSFVSHTLSHPTGGVRVTMALAYTVLIGAFAVHATYAVPALLSFAGRSPSNSSTPAKRIRKKRFSQATISTSLAGILLASLLSIVPLRHTDRLTISPSLRTRYDAVLAYAWPTRFFFRTS